MSRPQFDSKGRFTGGGLMGAGSRIMKHLINRGLARTFLVLTPTLRASIKEEFNCTDEEIDAAVMNGVQEFGDDFKTFLAEQKRPLSSQRR